MAASRATQFVALRSLARRGQQVRQLHLTGPATYASQTLNSEQRETHCRPSASTQDLSPHTRAFRTSRSLNAARDSSTIDFFYFPDIQSIDEPAELQVRVPILPTTEHTSQPALEQPEDTAAVMKPQISTMSADAVFLPMSELTDGHGMNIDFHAMADRVAANLRRMSVPVEERAGMMKQIWNDMVDDLSKASLKGTAV